MPLLSLYKYTNTFTERTHTAERKGKNKVKSLRFGIRLFCLLQCAVRCGYDENNDDCDDEEIESNGRGKVKKKVKEFFYTIY